MTFPPVDEQLAVIRRGIEKIVPEEELAPKLEQSRRTGKPLRIKYGIDPTNVSVHLGHTVPLRKVRQFQELGHQAVIIIGDYTARVGDPSGRDQARARLTAEQVDANAADYLDQISKVIDLDQVEVVRNGEWFGKMDFGAILELCSKVTIAQLLTRDDFSKRWKAETPIFMHECLYPIMQAWDSVEIKADIELGGTEQLYSFMLARDLQRDRGLPAQIGMMCPILVGTDGERRMGKSLGNFIGLSEPPLEMMKKFMQVPDKCMQMYFELLTDVPLDEVTEILAGHPKEAKTKLATAIISDYHSAEDAQAAAEEWQRQIGDGGLPADIPTVKLSRSELTDGALPAAILLKQTGMCASTGEARRSIAAGGAYLGEDKQRIQKHDEPVNVSDGLMVWVGKKRYCRVELTDD